MTSQHRAAGNAGPWALRLSSFPLMLLLMLPTINYRTPVIDGPDTTCAGAPLVWNCDSIAFSLHHHIFLAALAVDTLVLLAISASIIWCLERVFRNRFRVLQMLTVGAIWVLAAACIPVLALGFMEATYTWMPPDWLSGPYGYSGVGPAL